MVTRDVWGSAMEKTQAEAKTAWEKQFGWEVRDTPSAMLPKGFTKRSWGYSRPNFLDHVHVIRKAIDGHTMGTNVPGNKHDYGLLAMPYGFDSQDAHDLDAWCAEHGARWSIIGWSWWNSATVGVMVVPNG